jgi:sugar lactone lactonase YvrE
MAIAMVFTVGCDSSTRRTTATPQTINKALWVANGTNVLEFIPSQLSSASTTMAPHLANNSGSFGAPQGVVFDAAGDLWVIDGGTVAAGGGVKPSLFEFTPTQLSALGSNDTPTPNVTINSSSFTFPQQAVFDANGNLWVSDNMSNAVFAFTPAQLATSNVNATPNITITSNPAFTGPLGIAFDAAGDLWVANNGTTTIFEFNASHLPKTSTSVTLAPDVTLSDDGKGAIQASWALVFDSAGNLWSSNANAPNTVVEFAKANLGTNGSPTPAVTLSPTTIGGNSTLSAPNGIALDNLGDLAAISAATPFGIAFFEKAQLATGGTVAPDAFIVGNATTLNAPAGCNFGPVVN